MHDDGRWSELKTWRNKEMAIKESDVVVLKSAAAGRGGQGTAKTPAPRSAASLTARDWDRPREVWTHRTYHRSTYGGGDVGLIRRSYRNCLRWISRVNLAQRVH